MSPLKSICLLVFVGFVSAAWAQLDEDELAAAEFEEIDIDYDSSSEEQPAARGLWKNSKNQNRCNCFGNHKCSCCARPRIMGYKFQGCVNFTLYANDKQFEIALIYQDKQVAQYNFSLTAGDRICDRMPGKLDFLKFCLYTDTAETEEKGLTSCTSLDVIFKKTTVAIINFSCIQFKDGVLGFDDHQEVDRETMLKIKIKNPIKTVQGLIEKAKQKKE